MNAVYEKTYQYYLSQFDTIDFKSLEANLGVLLKDDGVVVPLFKKPYRISADGVIAPDGNQPALYISIILFKYLYMCPDIRPSNRQWASFKDLKDSGPLTTYFANDIERPIAVHFSGKKEALETSCQKLGGSPADLDSAYDLAFCFDALPRVPVLVLFNDADDEFPSACSFLFESCAEKYLDPECLGMIAGYLVQRLKKPDRI
jgi:hypothetical protein